MRWLTIPAPGVWESPQPAGPRWNGPGRRRTLIALVSGLAAMLVLIAVIALLARATPPQGSSPTAGGVNAGKQAPGGTAAPTSATTRTAPTATTTKTKATPTTTKAAFTPTARPVAGSVPSYAHVITIAEENRSYSDVIGSSSAPYINNTLLRAGALATNYTALVSSSLPNYMAWAGGDTLGWTGNCEPGPGCQSGGPTVASEAEAAGKTWKAYEENMTANCQNVVDGGTGGLYTIHHNPFPYYTALTDCASRDVPYSQLASDLQSPATLPSYVFITPNLDDDMHTGTVAQGDTWLAQQVPAIQNSPACQQSTCLIVIAWDEGSYDSSGAPLSSHVAAIFLGPGVKAGGQDTTAYGDYNITRTEEVALGLGPLTSHDAGAAPMSGMF